MFKWLETLWDTVVNATTSVNWGDVATDALTTSVAGAAVGALASAVSDGDVGEGLLYGAAGGLAAGGLMEFGDQFTDNWNWAANSAPTSVTGFGTSDPLAGLMEEFQGEYPDIDWDTKFGEGASISVSGEGLADAVSSSAGAAAATGDGSVLDLGGYLGLGKSNWYDGLAPVAMQVGGGLLAGAFAPDPAEAQLSIMDKQRQYDLEDQRRASGALASVEAPRGASVVDKSKPMQEDFSEIQQSVTV